MRLFLLPLSTGRTLLYAQRLNVTTTTKDISYVDKAVTAAAKKWTEWEKKNKGWQRKVVDYGNQAFRRIPYEEWGLKSVPPLSTRREAEELKGVEKVQLVFPGRTIPVQKAEDILMKLATERQALHKKRLILSVIAMPFTIPVGLLPVIPNLPFFYLCYRAWSHWRAINGGKHVQWLIRNKLVQPSPSETLDLLYSKDTPYDDTPGAKQQMLLTEKQAQDFSQTLEIPALGIELERAVYQVEEALKREADSEKIEEDVKEKTQEENKTKDKQGQ